MSKQNRNINQQATVETDEVSLKRRLGSTAIPGLLIEGMRIYPSFLSQRKTAMLESDCYKITKLIENDNSAKLIIQNNRSDFCIIDFYSNAESSSLFELLQTLIDVRKAQFYYCYMKYDRNVRRFFEFIEEDLERIFRGYLEDRLDKVVKRVFKFSLVELENSVDRQIRATDKFVKKDIDEETAIPLSKQNDYLTNAFIQNRKLKHEIKKKRFPTHLINTSETVRQLSFAKAMNCVAQRTLKPVINCLTSERPFCQRHPFGRRCLF